MIKCLIDIIKNKEIVAIVPIVEIPNQILLNLLIYYLNQ